MAVRDADLGALHDQYYYDVAMDLRDAIMAGTRQLDIDRAVAESEQVQTDWMAGDRDRVLAEADEAVRRVQASHLTEYGFSTEYGYSYDPGQ